MGTNYYGRIIPTLEQKTMLKKLIDENDFDEIKRNVDKLYSRGIIDFEDGKLYGGEVHLDKRSAGWKFLWNPNWYKKYKGHSEEVDNGDGSFRIMWVDDGFEVMKYYELTKKSIKEFIDREDVEIYDEYNEKQDKEEFWKMAVSWGYEKDDEGFDGETYEKWEKVQNPNYNPRVYANEYANFIEGCGFKVNKFRTDFYSDGLRFATCTEFS